MRRLLLREVAVLRADRLLGILGVTFCLLSAFAAWNGYGFRQLQQATIAAVKTEEATRLDSLDRLIAQLNTSDSATVAPGADPRSPAVAGRGIATRSLLLTPQPLSALAVGQSDLYPYFVRIASSSRQSAVNSEEIDNPIALLAGRLDLAFVLLALFPLFVLALTYNVLSSEREQGTLALIASQPADARRIILAKLVVRAAAVIALSVLISLVASSTGGRDMLTARGAAHLTLWIATVLAYGAFWFGIALAVNAIGRSSAANAVMVLGAWFAFVIVIPAMVSNLTVVTYPVPPRLSLVTAAREAQDSIAAAAPKSRDALSEYLAEHPQYRGAANADTSNAQVIGIANASVLENRTRHLYDEFDARLQSRQNAAERLRFLSPALATQTALLDAAGTGTERGRQFERAWVDSHERWRAFFNSLVFSGATLTRDDLAHVPVPAVPLDTTYTLLLRVLPSIAAVLLPTLLLVVWSVGRLRTARTPLG